MMLDLCYTSLVLTFVFLYDILGATRIFWDPSLDANNGGSSGGSDTLSNGAIAGAVVGSIAGVAIVGAVGFYAVNNFIAKKRSDALIQKDPSGL